MKLLVVAMLLAAHIAAADELDDTLHTAVANAPACTAKHCLGVHLHVAATDHALVATPEWLDAEIATANKHLALIDVGLRVVDIDRASAIRVTTPADRDAIVGSGLHAGAIDVYVVFRLDDIDGPDYIRGVTWRRKDGRKYIILSIAGGDRVLAHEDGHFFGLPHSRYAISIMNKTPRDKPPQADRRYSDEEVPIMRDELARLLKEKIVVEASP